MREFIILGRKTHYFSEGVVDKNPKTQKTSTRFR